MKSVQFKMYHAQLEHGTGGLRRYELRGLAVRRTSPGTYLVACSDVNAKKKGFSSMQAILTGPESQETVETYADVPVGLVAVDDEAARMVLRRLELRRWYVVLAKGPRTGSVRVLTCRTPDLGGRLRTDEQKRRAGNRQRASARPTDGADFAVQLLVRT